MPRPVPGIALVALNAAFASLALGLQVARGPEPSCFVERGGLLVIEAEHFAERGASTYAGYSVVHAWTDREDASGASGGRYLEVLPDERGEDGRGPPSPRDRSGATLRTLIHASTPGTYHVFVRGRSRGGESNGVHVGLDGELAGRGPGASSISGFRPKGVWNWENRRKHGHAGTAVVEMTPGLHVLNVWSRDDGFCLDKIVLSLEPEPPRDAGPAESVTRPAPPTDGILTPL